MSKSKFVIDKLAKLFEQGLISYKDLSSEILNILRSKRDEVVFKMQLTSKEETEILTKRIEKLEQKIEKLENSEPESKIEFKEILAYGNDKTIEVGAPFVDGAKVEAKLIKNGKPFKMSKRTGDYITVDDLIKEVGKDSTRFMMLSRSNDVELDFDFEKVTEKSKDNPVFYVQYAYARINSIFRLLNLNLSRKIKIQNKEFSLNNHEIEIMKKISEWPKCLYISTNKLEPHRITFYLYELATLFHAYWNLGKENNDFKFLDASNNMKENSLIILKSISIVIENGMRILGVSTPRQM